MSGEVKSKILAGLLIISVCLIIVPAGAIPGISNHSELVWNVLRSEHFRVLYHNGETEIAEEALKIAENIYEGITRDLGIQISKKTSIILVNYDDVSDFSSNSLNSFPLLLNISILSG